MKTIKNILILILIVIPLSVKAQSKIWIDGYVYTEDSIQNVVPFATLCFYDTEDKTNLLYFTMCGPNGNFTVKPYDHTNSYFVTVSAAGCEDRSFHIKSIPEFLDNKPFSGNLTTNIKLQRKSIPNITKKTYELNDSVNGLCEYLLGLPNICKDEYGWASRDGGSICILINGNIAKEQVVSSLNAIPTEAVSEIEYYELPQGSVYGVALNIVLKIGQKSMPPSYIMQESKFIY